MPTLKEIGKSRQLYEPISKSFGVRAERLTKSEFQSAVEEIKNKCKRFFPRVEELTPLDDKVTFGDVDLVILSDTTPERSDEDRMREIFGEDLLDYRHQKNDITDSLLLRLESGKIVQLDLARTKDNQDFEAKLIHGSKGQSSSVIGALARIYRYKFSVDGFYKIHTSSMHQVNDILVTKDLFEAMEMLGLDPQKWREAKKVDDIISLVASSKFFKPQFFVSSSLPNKPRSLIKKRSVQNYMYDKLATLPATVGAEDSPNLDTFIRDNFPEAFSRFEEGVIRLEESYNRPARITGDDVMAAFQIPPSELVGMVLKFIKDNYPDATSITHDIEEKTKDYLRNL